MTEVHVIIAHSYAGDSHFVTDEGTLAPTGEYEGVLFAGDSDSAMDELDRRSALIPEHLSANLRFIELKRAPL